MGDEESVIRGLAVRLAQSESFLELHDAVYEQAVGSAMDTGSFSVGPWTLTLEVPRMTAEAAAIWFGLSLLDASLLVDGHLVRGEN